MSRLLRSIVCGAIAGLACIAAADEPLIQTRPASGQWARYYTTLAIDGREQVIFWHVRDTGAEQFNGKDCRRLELAVFEGDDTSPQRAYQLLIPADGYGPGQHPVRAAARIRLWTPDEPGREIGSLDEHDVLLAAMLDGIQGDPQPSPTKETVRWQRGEYACEVQTGTRETTTVFGSLRIAFRVPRHEAAPFGVAGFSQDWIVKTGESEHTVRVSAALEDQGEQAESFFP